MRPWLGEHHLCLTFHYLRQVMSERAGMILSNKRWSLPTSFHCPLVAAQPSTVEIRPSKVNRNTCSVCLRLEWVSYEPQCLYFYRESPTGLLYQLESVKIHNQVVQGQENPGFGSGIERHVRTTTDPANLSQFAVMAWTIFPRC